MSSASSQISGRESPHLNILIVGEADVGKSSLALKFTENTFLDKPITTGVEFNQKIITIDEEPVRIQIWDTQGQEKFRTITSSYYRSEKKGHGVIVAFDITNPKSFRETSKWIADIKSYARPGTPTILVGTKRDLEKQRVVDYWEATQHAYQLGTEFMETSAKTGLNVIEVFQAISRKALSDLRPPTPQKSSNKKKNKKDETSPRGSTNIKSHSKTSPRSPREDESPFETFPKKKRSCIIL